MAELPERLPLVARITPFPEQPLPPLRPAERLAAQPELLRHRSGATRVSGVELTGDFAGPPLDACLRALSGLPVSLSQGESFRMRVGVDALDGLQEVALEGGLLRLGRAR